MIYITPRIQIPERDLQESFIQSSGPGGQNVNKVATAVQLRFDAANSTLLDEELKIRLKRIAGRRMTAEGVVVIEARRYRDQEKNRQEARNRLAALVRGAAEKPKIRRQTRPTKSSIQRRVEAKKKHGDLKKARNKVRSDEY